MSNSSLKLPDSFYKRCPLSYSAPQGIRQLALPKRGSMKLKASNKIWGSRAGEVVRGRDLRHYCYCALVQLARSIHTVLFALPSCLRKKQMIYITITGL